MIYLVRHGETDLNVAGRHQGHIDSPLTRRGRLQAQAAARALTKRIDTLDVVIFASPLGRALTTAQIIADALHVATPIILDPDLREISMGSAEGMTEAEMGERWPGRVQKLAADALSFEAPDGESLRGLAERTGRALDRVSANGATSRIIVSHGISGRVLRTLYLGLPPNDSVKFDAPQDVLFCLAAGKIERIPFPVT
jgi:probable phosphoglycerate mutase